MWWLASGDARGRRNAHLANGVCPLGHQHCLCARPGSCCCRLAARVTAADDDHIGRAGRAQNRGQRRAWRRTEQRQERHGREHRDDTRTRGDARAHCQAGCLSPPVFRHHHTTTDGQSPVSPKWAPRPTSPFACPHHTLAFTVELEEPILWHKKDSGVIHTPGLLLRRYAVGFVFPGPPSHRNRARKRSPLLARPFLSPKPFPQGSPPYHS